VVLDPGLLRITDVTAGLKDTGIIVINTKRSAAEISKLVGGKWPVAAVNASGVAKETIGVNIVNTTMLGALVKACPVVKMDSLLDPLNHRFGVRGKQNFESASKAYQRIVVEKKAKTPGKVTLQFPAEKVLSWKEILVGCAVNTPGSTVEYSTGDWRSQRPVWDHDKCIKCGICYIVCPQACVGQNEEKFFIANYYHCFGCGICATECWPKAISMVEEKE
ncbi:MAG: 2-oxoacid:acceptor oxidoreductase family protein, partial [Dehalococcoidia bacterium]|nr:2-oxoacid:acceptor oxidoreductase family protein [Dehalococcoidia bacterium]